MIKEKIINEIKNKKNCINLEKFIDICLFSQEGYYYNNLPIGKSGDFITAPEISQLFGEILGLYILENWKKKYSCNINLVELGPGNGTLIDDILRITENKYNFHDSININLIEINKKLLSLQKKRLLKKQYNNIVFNWHNDFSKIQSVPSIIIANEFFDCFPVRHFISKNEVWYEKMIKYNFNEMKFYYENLPVENNKLLFKIKNYNSSKILELSEKREDYFDRICKFINHSEGTIIVIDYGYYDHPDSFTLQAMYNHRYSNLLDNAGKQDITSLVDFKSLIAIAENNNLKIDKFCNQKDFLIDNGIIHLKNKIFENCNKKQQDNLENGYKRLVDENGMGENFKFLIVSK